MYVRFVQCVCMYVCIVCVYVCIHRSRYLGFLCGEGLFFDLSLSYLMANSRQNTLGMYVWMYKCMHSMYVSLYVLYVHMYACMYVCMYICVFMKLKLQFNFEIKTTKSSLSLHTFATMPIIKSMYVCMYVCMYVPLKSLF